MFELFNDEDSNFRFRITAPDGTVMATSRPFPDKQSAVAGIRDVREYAGMGHIADMCLAPAAFAAPRAKLPAAAYPGTEARCSSLRPAPFPWIHQPDARLTRTPVLDPARRSI
ncbi:MULTISPECIES: YegP family protein [unclassified Arthrobacter]|uniref:YegP family protein n=1 Tax=unclassified Arthrobacter TaxID=235627 RepID=UPI0021A27AC6|nr:YegP family protein [Arthrobacter sp. MAHUQ-56]